MLHHDRILFEQLILRASDSLGIEAGIVEKDYYVTLFLKGIAEKQPDIIFKGGTSLSKCYKLIERFSEDVDLNLECEARPTQGQRRLLKSNILSVIESMGLNLSNPDEIRSRRDYNRYVVDYPVVSSSAYLKPQLIVETAVYIRAYPSRRMPASSFIYDYLAQTDRFDLINAYDLAPFELNVQSSERTFIDKLYALGDYYLDNKVTEHSRHIYDLYKLSSVVEINENLRLLAKNVAAERKPHRTCLSVQDGVDMHQLLQEIIDKDAYMHKSDRACHMHGENLPPRRRFSATSPEKVASVKDRPHTVRSTQETCDFNTGGPENDGLPKDPYAAQQGMQSA